MNRFAPIALLIVPLSGIPMPLGEIGEPCEPNVTALLDPSNLKWKHLAAPSTPIPTSKAVTRTSVLSG